MRLIPRTYLLLIALTVGATSCIETAPDHLTYIVDITPTSKGIERRISIVRTMNDDSTQTPRALRVEDEVADRFERVYGSRPNSIAPESLGSDTALVYRVRGKLAQIPNDIGGWGILSRYESSLGTSYSYTEQFRSNDDLLASLERRLAAADSVVDLTVGWTEAHLGRLPGWPKLHRYLDREVRRNLRNCALRMWSVDSTMDEVAYTFAERDSTIGGLLTLYLASSALQSGPQASVAVDSLTGLPALEQGLATMRAAFAARLGLRGREETERTLSFLSRPDTANASLTRYLASTAKTSAEDVAIRWNRLSRATLPGLPDEDGISGWDSVVVRLTVPDSPTLVLSTGTQTSDSNVAVWAGRVPKSGSRGRLDPLVCSASWQIPEEAIQRKLFGDVVLIGPDLESYAMWVALLDPVQRAEWERMLMRLRPGKLGPLETFRFSSGRSWEYGRRFLGRHLLLDLLRKYSITPE